MDVNMTQLEWPILENNESQFTVYVLSSHEWLQTSEPDLCNGKILKLVPRRDICINCINFSGIILKNNDTLLGWMSCTWLVVTSHFNFYDTGNHAYSTFIMHVNFKSFLKYPSLDHRCWWCIKYVVQFSHWTTLCTQYTAHVCSMIMQMIIINMCVAT